MSKQKKSIIASFGLLASGIEEDAAAKSRSAAGEGENAVRATPLPRVGAGVIGAAQRSIGELRDERDRLKALLDAGGGGITSLDPELVDPSPFPDRLADDHEADYATFRQMIAEEGQKVPIQVRPHPSRPGRYQTVFGHRRVRAARDLGLPVKAVVSEISDRDLVVSQGLENAARQDLSWIERALFARRMDDAGIRPRDIRAALAIDDAELARMRAAYRNLPMEVIEAIGRAPKVGRPRWVEFAKLYAERAERMADVRMALDAARARSLPSDERFQQAMAALRKPSEKPQAQSFELRTAEGMTLGVVSSSDKEWRMQAKGGAGSRFSAFLSARMPELVAEFLARDSAQDD